MLAMGEKSVDKLVRIMKPTHFEKLSTGITAEERICKQKSICRYSPG